MTTAVSTKEAEGGFSGYGTITQPTRDKAETASKEAGATESAKDKRNERSSSVIRRAKPLRGICALHACARLPWQHKRLCHEGRTEPLGWEGYLFTMFCTARQLHGPITSILPSLHGILTTPVDQLVRDLSPSPVVVMPGTSFVTLPLAFYS